MKPLKRKLVTRHVWLSMSEKLREVEQIVGGTRAYEVAIERLPEPHVRSGRITEAWFEEHISRQAKAEGYDGAVFLMSEAEAKRWGVKDGLRGSTLRDGDQFDEMWVCANEDGAVPFEEGHANRFVETLVHEEGHTAEHRGQTPYRVHDFDFANERFDIRGFWRQTLRYQESRQSLLYRLVLITISLMKRLVGRLKAKSLYHTALEALGTDASPSDIAPDELGCAETVSNIIRGVIPDFPVVTGTWTLWDILRNHPRFEQTSVPMPSDVIISPTGTGNGSFPGHAGIVGEGVVMSSDSRTGRFEKNYTLEEWMERYQKQGGYPVYFYRKI